MATYRRFETAAELALRLRDAPDNRLMDELDAELGPLETEQLRPTADLYAARLAAQAAGALAMRRRYEGDIMCATLCAIKWCRRNERSQLWLAVFVWLTVALTVALAAAVYFAPQIAAWRGR